MENAIALEIKIISLTKLIKGGAAIFPAIIKNHHKAIDGATIVIPVLSKSLREWVFS